MTTTRQNILAHIKSILETVTSIEYVEVNKMSVVDIETVPFPCAFIFSDRETKIGDDRAVIGKENWEWLINIELWTDERTDPEVLLGAVHAAMVGDYTLGGHAVTSDRISSTMYVLNPERAITATVLDYSVIYRHTKGTP